jgi:hypothetical protein
MVMAALAVMPVRAAMVVRARPGRMAMPPRWPVLLVMTAVLAAMVVRAAPAVSVA